MLSIKQQGLYSELRNKHIVIICLLLLIYAAGVTVRLHDLPRWIEEPERAFYSGEPLLKTSDGYYYLAYSRDILHDNYSEIDQKRAVPDSPRRPFPPPLLSVITALSARLTSLSLNWTALILPALAGPLLVIPLYGIGSFFGGWLTGILSALLGVTADYLVSRSSAGWFDTDPLIPFFTYAVTWCFIWFGNCNGAYRYFYMAAGIICSALFFWWWDQPPEVVAGLCLYPFLVSIIFFYRPGYREALLFTGIMAVTGMLFLAWKGIDAPLNAINALSAKLHYISKSSTGDFPNIGISISEQHLLSPGTVAAFTTGGMPQLVLAFTGLSALTIRKPIHCLYLVAPLAAGCLSFFFAQRFIIFLCPIAAMGIAFFINELWFHGNRKIYKYFAVLMSLLAISGQFIQNTKTTQWPFITPASARGMHAINLKTPPDAIAWSWWDQGYALIYWSDRGTINDGSVHSGERSVYNAIPLATDNARLAANFMSFYVVHGMRGMQKLYDIAGGKEKGLELLENILGAGPEGCGKYMELFPEMDGQAILHYMFPPETPPIYLFIDKRMMKVAHWWGWFGTWNPATHTGKKSFSRLYDSLIISPERIISMWGFHVDLETGSIPKLPPGKKLKTIFLYDDDSLRTIDYGKNGMILNVNIPARFALLQEMPLASSITTRLFVTPSPHEKYFMPLENKSPDHQIWKVMPDRWK